MLKTIMNTQKALQERLGYNFETMTDEQRAAFMRDHRGYLEDEVAEALYEMPFYKAWKNYSGMPDEAKQEAWQKVRMELVDSLHFFVNLLLAAGFTADELYKMYMAKNKENHRRQDDGYTSDVSYRDQAVEDVMEFEPTCTVMMDDTFECTDDFVAVLKMDGERTALRYNTDTLSLGFAVKLLAKEYFEQLQALDEQDRAEVENIIGEMTLKEVDNG